MSSRDRPSLVLVLVVATIVAGIGLAIIAAGVGPGWDARVVDTRPTPTIGHVELGDGYGQP